MSRSFWGRKWRTLLKTTGSFFWLLKQVNGSAISPHRAPVLGYVGGTTIPCKPDAVLQLFCEGVHADSTTESFANLRMGPAMVR